MRIRKLLAVAVAVSGLWACAQSTGYFPPEALPPPNLLRGGVETGLVTVRVIVQFRQPVAFNDETLLKTLQTQAQAPVHYLAAVSSDTHVYGLQLAADQAPTAALQRLSALPSIARAELDGKVK